jgi:hypothetical protein
MGDVSKIQESIGLCLIGALLYDPQKATLDSKRKVHFCDSYPIEKGKVKIFSRKRTVNHYERTISLINLLTGR